MTRRLVHYFLFCAVALGCPCALAATPITPACGDTIGPGGSYVLTADLGPCSTSPALTVDSASLNLGGHTILGSNSSGLGVLLTGTSARLRNGTVRDFQDDGVILIGDGQHVVRSVVSRDNGVNGFVLDAPQSTLRNCQAVDNQSDGFDIESNGSRLRGNTANGNGSDGFEIDGSENRLARNRALNNQSDGFEIDSDESHYIENRAEGNLDDGFDIGGSNSELVRNKANANGGEGFSAGSAGNRIVECRGRDNQSFDATDFVDACISNTWRRNDFGTTSLSCIR